MNRRELRTLRGAGIAAMAFSVLACGPAAQAEDSLGDEAVAGSPHSDVTVAAQEIPLSGTETPEDWAILVQRVEWAREQGLDTAPLGVAIAEIGRTFVGNPYTPGTLEVAEPEALVVNLREFDCVTFVESVVALARVVRAPRAATDEEAEIRNAFLQELLSLRYRNGSLNGYVSRLHYFSEWIADNARRGGMRSLAGDLGPDRDPEPLSFMSAHSEAYRQLAEPVYLQAIEEMEQRLSAEPRAWVPQDKIAAAAERIQDGDVIAATSTLEGLDIAHTGIALWVDGELHLMHAPLVGKSVEISDRPLADRIQGFRSQDGIMVARVLERGS